jgi:hypothetical protein
MSLKIKKNGKMGEICAPMNFTQFLTLKSLVRNELFEKLVNSKERICLE